MYKYDKKRLFDTCCHFLIEGVLLRQLKILSYFCLIFWAAVSIGCDYKVIMLSDIHLSPHQKMKMPYSPSKKGTDLDLLSFDSLIKKISAMPFNEQAIWVLGDNIGHHVGLKERRHVLETVYRRFDELKTPAFFIHGNNDSLAGNYQAFSSHLGSPYDVALDVLPQHNSGFTTSADIQFCKQSNEDVFPCIYSESKSEGHFTTQLKPGLTLIALNSVVFNGDHFFNDQSGAEAAFKWLEEQLQQATTQSHAVIIAMHIPPTFNLHKKLFHFRQKGMLNSIYQNRFINILKKSQQKDALNLLAIVAGHTHHDELHIIHLGNALNANLPVIVNPALSTLHGNAPAFQTLCFNKKHEGWQLSQIDAYHIEDEALSFNRYKRIVLDTCEKNHMTTCFSELLGNTSLLVEHVVSHYFADNHQQERRLKTSIDELVQ